MMVRSLVPSDLVDPTQERDPSRDSVSDLDSDPKKSAGLENQFLAEAPIDKLMPPSVYSFAVGTKSHSATRRGTEQIYSALEYFHSMGSIPCI